jgi:hypothetical protein
MIAYRAHLALVTSSLVLACGGSSPGPTTPAHDVHDGSRPHHECGEHAKAHVYDIHDEDGQDHASPCSTNGKEDHSGNVRLDTVAEGIKVTIHVSDDDVNEGVLGSDLKGRDAMIVYPKGRDKKGVEVPLVRTKHGYKGEKLIPFNDLEKLTDEGTKLEISIHDHDDNHKDGAHEEFKVSIAISAGKSCEKAIDENPQEIVMGKKGAPDLTNDQLGRPMQNSAFMAHCGLADSASADICVAVKKGKPLGVSVKTAPMNNKVATCIDKATRKLSFPQSDKLDVVKQHF